MHRGSRRRHLPPLRALVAFEAAARHLSFTDASDELAVTQGAISTQISKLEAYLGTKLFLRKIREVSLTEEGEKLARTCCKAFENIERDIELITTVQLNDILTIAASTYVTTRWLSNRINGFLSKHPDTVVRFQHSVNTSEFEIDDVDIAIRWGNGNWPRTSAELLLPMAMRLACSPTLLRGANAIKSTRDILNHPFLCNLPEMNLWGEWLKLVGLEWSEVRSQRVLADSNVRVQAAIDCQGVVLVDDLAAGDIAAGRLVVPFDVSLGGYGYYIVRPSGIKESAISEVFQKWLISSARSVGG